MSTQQHASTEEQTPTQDFLNWNHLPDDVYTDCKTVEQVLRISRFHRWREGSRGKLPYYKFGGATRYRVGDVRSYARDSKVQS